jgi:hypothetical protein
MVIQSSGGTHFRNNNNQIYNTIHAAGVYSNDGDPAFYANIQSSIYALFLGHYQGAQKFGIRFRDTSLHTFIHSNTTALKILNGSTIAIQSRNASDTAYGAIVGVMSDVSARSLKRAIVPANSALVDIESTPIYRYKYTNDAPDTNRVGFMLDEAPLYLREGEGYHLGSAIGTLWKGMQEIIAMIRVVEGRLDKLPRVE